MLGLYDETRVSEEKGVARMEGNRAFAACHPAVLLLYFLLMLAFAVCLMHPACLGISLGCALGCAVLFRGWRAVGRSLLWIAPASLLAAGINPLFVHQGVTVVGKLPWGAPLTKESLLYGLAAGALLGAVLLWSLCWSAAFTADQFGYLLGRLTPALALVLSMTLSFLPRLRRQVDQTRLAQRALLGDRAAKDGKTRLRRSTALLSVLVTWSLEGSIETSQAMCSRGYGLPGRTSYAAYRLYRRDKGLLLWLALSGAAMVGGWAAGCLKYIYYPAVSGTWGRATGGLLALQLVLSLTPLLLEGWEALQWKRRNSPVKWSKPL